MARLHTAVVAVLGLVASAFASPQQITPSIRTPPASATATATVTNVPVATPACALAASRQAAYFSAFPNSKLKAALAPTTHTYY
jgi:hypothetical protein